MTIQPVAASVLEAACSSDGTAGFACQGCGCCKVDRPVRPCTCCAAKPNASDSNQPDCCHEDSLGCCSDLNDNSDNPPVWMIVSPENDPFAGHSIAQGPQIAVISTAMLNAESTTRHDSTVRKVCLCVKTPALPAEPAPRSPVNEIRDLNSLCGYCVGTAANAHVRFPGLTGAESVHPLASPHFTQIVLCVWHL